MCTNVSSPNHPLLLPASQHNSPNQIDCTEQIAIFPERQIRVFDLGFKATRPGCIIMRDFGGWSCICWISNAFAPDPSRLPPTLKWWCWDCSVERSRITFKVLSQHIYQFAHIPGTDICMRALPDVLLAPRPFNDGKPRLLLCLY